MELTARRDRGAHRRDAARRRRRGRARDVVRHRLASRSSRARASSRSRGARRSRLRRRRVRARRDASRSSTRRRRLAPDGVRGRARSTTPSTRSPRLGRGGARRRSRGATVVGITGSAGQDRHQGPDRRRARPPSSTCTPARGRTTTRSGCRSRCSARRPRPRRSCSRWARASPATSPRCARSRARRSV